MDTGRRGNVPSGPGRAAKRSTDEVEDLRALIGRIGRPVHLVGMSYGATVALRAAAAGLPLRSLVLWKPPLYAAGQELAPVLTGFGELTARGDRRRDDRLLAEKMARVPAALLDLMDAGEPAGSEPDDAPGWCRALASMVADTADMERWCHAHDIARPAWGSTVASRSRVSGIGCQCRLSAAAVWGR
ncbi:hypothetical protein GCM10010145_47200 [Streptomyces ruber]|uniref:AB hydrolase-1 domain-containing protein n=2 Tax=Streptomyces TaxID=1883 RepID=A0A918BLC6_9ACTN|nr:hypothetical protein GCM10010145_47200 [Streptomyces ruber]